MLLYNNADLRQEIFEAFEPDSDDESVGPTNQVEAFREFKREADKALDLMRANGLKIEDSDSEDEPEVEEEADEEDEGTGVMTSQLRHFVIQVSGIDLTGPNQADGRNTSRVQCCSISLRRPTIRNLPFRVIK